MDIATGQPDGHGPSLLPYSPDVSPPVAPQPATSPATAERVPEAVAPSLDPAWYAAPLAAAVGDVAGAYQAGMAASGERHGHYAGQLGHAGAGYGDEMTLPPVPAYGPVPPGGYPDPGDEPVSGEG